MARIKKVVFIGLFCFQIVGFRIVKILTLLYHSFIFSCENNTPLYEKGIKKIETTVEIALSICTLRLYKASQKLGVGREPVYEIDPWSQEI